MGFSLYWGPFHPALERCFLDELKKNRDTDPLAPLTVLVPNFQLVPYLRRLASRELGAHFNLRFDTLAREAFRTTEGGYLQNGTRPLQEALQSWVLRGLVPKVLTPESPLHVLSESPGLFRTLLSGLSELRQGLFTPEILEAAAKKASVTKRASMAREWAAWMRGYSAWKEKHHFHDREDVLEAVLKVPEGSSGPVWVYGFYDANALQRQVLLHLAGHEHDRWFIPYQEREAYEYARPFFEWARRSASATESAPGGCDPRPWPLSRLVGALFARTESSEKPPPLPPYDASAFKILLAPGGTSEMEEAARLLVKGLERHPGVRLSDTACLFRSPGAYRRDAVDGFHELGIPTESRLRSSLLASPTGKAADLLLETLREDLARGPLMDLVACPAVDPGGFGLKVEQWNPSGWDLLTKELKHTRGAGVLIDRLRTEIRSERGRDEEERPLRDQDARTLLKVGLQLADLSARLAASRRWEGSIAILAAALRELLVPSREKEGLVGSLEGLAEMEGIGVTFVPENLAAVTRTLWEAMTLSPSSLEGGVRLLDLMESRGLAFDVVIVPGMAEGSVPPGEHPDPLLPDAEREWLNDAGRPSGAWLPLKSASREEERLLFALAVASARKALLLTAPLSDSVSGDERAPSPYLYEALEAVTGTHHERIGEEKHLVRVVRTRDRVVRPMEECLSAREVLEAALREARRGWGRETATALVRRKPFALEGVRLMRERQGRRIFTPYDGVFHDPEAVRRLAGADGLSGVTVSASRIETYATCPLRYFFRYVLHLNPEREPEDAVRADPLERGQVLHTILEETFREGSRAGWWEPPAGKRDEKAAMDFLERTAQAAFDRFEKVGVTGAPALWRADRNGLLGDLKRVLLVSLRDPDWVPVVVEKAFGMDGAEAVSFPVPGGELHLMGRIDRVDRSGRDAHLRVVDYKTGRFGSDYADQKMRNGRKVQLAVYLWAARSLFAGTRPLVGVYDFFTEDGGRRRVQYETPDDDSLETMRSVLSKVLGTVASGAARGLFPAMAGDCRACDFKTLCGVEQEKRAERKADDPKVAEIRSLEGIP